ncbi:Nose resistant-to-fluoxetine protein, N-terminal,Acyltransferase 3 [Cinara cedri]|uniref:Nose resistant-to-fluoxetine protein, N-terminal,Acyltransferase 3 n=1 Tax=Cinara cedri TaxID=506608 RepID=A0A5E4MS87_9HEMI|nr:Nose resistant-to-fluoxetine protein, N-terminal,Acyltransferase 3 [Cinara cedri]
MKGLTTFVVLLVSLLACARAGFETFPYEFYEELKTQEHGQCSVDVNRMLDGVKNLDGWALEMVDSSAKIPSGILRGNLNQYGDFDECINTVHENGEPVKYCLAAIQLKHNSIFGDRISAHNQVKNNLTDPGHRLPKFSTVYWGVCVPSSCSPDDVSSAVSSTALRFYNVEVLVENDMCQMKRIPKKSTDFDLVRFFTAIFLLAMGMFAQGAVCTPDELDPDVEHSAHLMLRIAQVLRNSFSIKRNYQSLFISPTKNGFKSLQGIRALNMISLLLCHMVMAKMFLPYLNKTEMSENMSKPWLVTGRVAYLYTDSFLVISGFLAAYTLSRFSPIKSIISRYIRLTATLVTVMVICAKYLPEMNYGPMWNMVITRHSDLCYKNWWRNVLYIQNLFGFKNMCLTHTHQLAIDFQLFMMAIPLMYLLRKSKVVALSIIMTIMSISTILRYQSVKNNNLSTVVYFGADISQLNRTFDLTYTLPSHRATVYLMGFLVGYWMQQKGSLNISNIQVKQMWLIATVCGLLAVFGPYQLSNMNYVYNNVHLALYNAAAPILWSIFILWCIIATDNGHGGWFGKLLCWNSFTFLSKISYAVYLVQYPVFFYYVGSARGPSLHTVSTMFDIGQIVLIMVLSIFLTLIIDIPFQKIGKRVTEGVYEKIKLF